MHNPNMMIITFLMFYLSFFVGYQLALAFIGVSLPMKQSLLQILIFSIIGFISKIAFNAPTTIHGIVVVVSGAGLLYLFNKIDITFSFIGSLLSYITLTLGSLLMACPIFVKLGYVIPLKFNGINWLFLCLLEMIVPTLVLIILKTAKFSLMKYIPITK
jgi:hypothetical protein